MSKTETGSASFWPATAAALVAFGALYANSPSPELIFLIVALLATHIIPARLSAGVVTTWVLRLVAYGIIITLVRDRATDEQFLAFDPAPRALVGEIFAAEYVLHRWHQVAPVRAVTFIATGFVLLAASNSRSESQIELFPYIAPVYFLLIAFALRGYRERVSARVRGRGTRAALLLRGSAIACALLLGAASVQAVWVYRMALTELGSRLLQDREAPERTGMSQTPQLGRMFDLQGSDQRILRITGEFGEAHLRGMSFSSYQRGGWGPAVPDRQYTAFESAPAPAGGGTAEVTTLARVSRLHFAPLGASGIVLEPGESADWAPDQGGPVRTRESQPLPYEIVPGGDYHQGPLAVPLTAKSRASYLEVPQEIRPEVRALARRIGAGRGSEPDRVQAVVAYLLNNHRYSLTIDPGAGDPVSNFLIGKMAGHCEYFGSAAVILLRLQGIPARYVTGYYAHEGGGPGVTIVRQRDAHAWAEAWVNGVGWVTVDATPGDGRPDALAKRISRLQAAWEWVQDRWSALLEWLAERTAAQQVAMLISLAVLLLLARLWKVYRDRRTKGQAEFTYASSDAALAALAARFDRLLSQRGVSVPAGKTWLEEIAAAEQTTSETPERRIDPGLIESARSFVRTYNDARFGGSDIAENVDQLEKEIAFLEAQSASSANDTKENK